MDAVKLFNQELSSLYELKPPISKAKMTSITKGAIKAIKFYKHVVQSVEKFIQKCRPEYKIPGLYVIDSIVRQSRHQFGAEKDVFAPRFAKNVQFTFFHLYKCTEEEKSKVIRVLNLWQKNEVFPSEVIQPLFDMANAKSDIFRQLDEQVKAGGGKPHQPGLQSTPSKSGGGSMIQVSSEFRSSDPPTGMHPSPSSSNDQQMTQQLQTILHLLKNHAQPSSEQVKFNKKLLDFDYSDDEDATEPIDQQPSPAMLEALQGILSNPMVLQKLKNMGAISDHQIHQLQQLLPAAQQQGHSQQQFQQPPPQMSSILQGGYLHGVPAPQGIDTASMQFQQYKDYNQQHMNLQHRVALNQHMYSSSAMGWAGGPPHGHPGFTALKLPGQSPLEEGERAETDEDIQIVEDRTVNSGGWNKRGGGGGRRRSRSRSRDRKRGRRSRSRSRDRRGGRRGGDDDDARSRSKERRDRSRPTEEDKERDRIRKKEREKKGLPPIREGYLSVCSTTLWVGHLSKLVAEDDLSDLFGEFGEVNIISLIAPRGCAFVCMNRRMDASKALKALHKHKLQGKPITLAWAPGKGMKDKQWKDFWDVDLGVSYIPIDKLDPQVDMVALEDGGMFDEDTMPDWMKTMRGVAPNSSHIPPAGSAQFIPVPDGVPPSRNPLIQSHISLHGQDPTQIPIPVTGHPPGLPPFGLPPGAPPPVGLLPGAGPGLLSPPPGARGLVGAAPPNLLLGPPIGPHQYPVVGASLLSGPPPGFAGFDASQPPPGLRLPFLPPRMAPPMENMETNNGSSSHDDMDLDHDHDQRGLSGGPPGRRVEPRARESRWNRDKEGGGLMNDENSLANRLRNLAGHGNEDPAGSRGPGVAWQPPINGGNGPPFDEMMDCNDDGMRDAGPPFHRGPPQFDDGPPMRFNPRSGPMPNGEDHFPPEMAPPLFGGPDRRVFDDPSFQGGPDGGFGPGGAFHDAPPFHGGAPPPFGMLDGPFNNGLPPFGAGEFGGRGVRGGRRGRGPRGGFRGRGGFLRDGPPGGGLWMEEGPPQNFNPFEPGKEMFDPSRDAIGGGSPWERGSRGGGSGGRGFGSRGVFPLASGQVLPSLMDCPDDRTTFDRCENSERPQRRERKSRWGGDEEHQGRIPDEPKTTPGQEEVQEQSSDDLPGSTPEKRQSETDTEIASETEGFVGGNCVKVVQDAVAHATEDHFYPVVKEGEAYALIETENSSKTEQEDDFPAAEEDNPGENVLAIREELIAPRADQPKQQTTLLHDCLPVESPNLPSGPNSPEEGDSFAAEPCATLYEDETFTLTNKASDGQEPRTDDGEPRTEADVAQTQFAFALEPADPIAQDVDHTIGEVDGGTEHQHADVEQSEEPAAAGDE